MEIIESSLGSNDGNGSGIAFAVNNFFFPLLSIDGENIVKFVIFLETNVFKLSNANCLLLEIERKKNYCI